MRRPYKSKKSFVELQQEQSHLKNLTEKLRLFTDSIDDIELKANPTVDEIAWLAWGNTRVKNLLQEIRLESAA